jgi:hypothetical protein
MDLGLLSIAEEDFVEELPQELWALILQHVPWRQRLSACALVSQKLARAAAAATRSVLASCYAKPQQHDAFLSWTTRHGSSLAMLYLTSRPIYSPILQLPCPNLAQLELHECAVQLCASSEGLGLLHSCPALSQLVVFGSILLDGVADQPAEGVPSVAVPRLKHLALCCELPRPTAPH